VVNDSLFDDVFSDRKVGVDLYPAIAAVQILLMIYMIFFYPLMTDVNGFSLEESTKYYQFSSDMVIGVLVHVLVMIAERYIAIMGRVRSTKLIVKYVFTLVIFALFSWFIYYLAPFKNLLTSEANLYAPSYALIAFSFFYFFYFYLSALQIKYGYKEVKSLNSLMTRRGFANYYAVSIYTAIPFLYELKIIIDWTFTNTSMSLFDWFRQFSIYLRAFKSKIQYYNATGYDYIRPQPWYQKIIGWVGFILIIIIIFGPMVLFSGLNPIAQPNLVVGGSLSVALQVQGGNSFPLYTTSHFSNPPQNFTQATFQA
jgi:piezo-type mechanosensitive ion channel component 1/2